MELTPDFLKFCRRRKINPEKLLAQFMADASEGSGTGGSNERLAAAQYVTLVELIVTTDVEHAMKPQYPPSVYEDEEE